MAQKTLSIIQIIVALLLMITILLQQRGSDMGSLFGGGGGGDNVYRAKRGIEKILFRATIILAALFLGTAFLGMIV